MQITVFGATGRTGEPFLEQALADGHDVVAFAREPSTLETTQDSLSVVEGTVRSPDAVERAVSGSEAVVSVLGHTDSSSDDVLEMGGRNIIQAMDADGVSRFVTLVGAGVRHPNDEIGLSGKLMGTLMKLLSRDLLEDSNRHVESLQATELDWTVVRAPRLTNGEHTGSYRSGYLSLGLRDSISRADVAAFMLELATSDSYVREMPTITSRGAN